jgi:hypothetical protein
MKPITLFVAVALAAAPAAPALAGWKLVPQAKPIAVAKGTLTITPAEAWNRQTSRPIPKGELWTLDGLGLNELYFVSGLIPGETIYKDTKKKDRPLPQMTRTTQLTDIPELFESSNRVVLNTSMFEITATEPTTLGGQPGVKFAYRYAVQGSPLIRRGLASATISAGKLYLISFTAPAIHYFDRDAARAEALMASATI